MVGQYGTKTLTGTNEVKWSGGAHCQLPSLKVYGGALESTSNYSYDNPRELYPNHMRYKTFDSNGNELVMFDTGKLRRVGSHRDERDFCTGTLKRRINTIYLDGKSEQGKITVKPTKFDAIYYIAYTLPYPLAKTGVEAIVSTHFKSLWAPLDGNFYAPDVNTIYFCIKNPHDTDSNAPDLSTTNGWNTWLESHPVTVWYAMAEPIITSTSSIVLPNEGGRVEAYANFYETNVPFELSYITHS